MLIFPTLQGRISRKRAQELREQEAQRDALALASYTHHQAQLAAHHQLELAAHARLQFQANLSSFQHNATTGVTPTVNPLLKPPNPRDASPFNMAAAAAAAAAVAAYGHAPHLNPALSTISCDPTLSQLAKHQELFLLQQQQDEAFQRFYLQHQQVQAQVQAAQALSLTAGTVDPTTIPAASVIFL